MTKTSNRLAEEKSPYLLQHASNPVDWYPWGAEAFRRASAEQKPVFLSIGYSSCHWCHVMAHESFEDAEVAELLNGNFVPVKVDREERPDIDGLYMLSCQILTGTAGWPLTVVTTPEKKPFFAATYIPKESRMGQTGLMELLPRISELWKNHRREVEKSADDISSALGRELRLPSGRADSPEAVLEKACEQIRENFDRTYGGFGMALKFPMAHQLIFLLRHWRRTADEESRKMAVFSLEAMARGGIFDHVGFGFHRYSTDREWLVPHFEKMLYDQAMLALAYLEGFELTGDAAFAGKAREILTYVLRDLASAEGGFYSGEDADSEGVEGKFYVWTEDEVRKTLGEKEARLWVDAFNIKTAGNFAPEHGDAGSAANIPHLKEPLERIAARNGVPASELRQVLANARVKLFRAREKRVRPHRDEKILADWNGLMIAALARGTRVLATSGYAEPAVKAFRFITERLHGGGRLIHSSTFRNPFSFVDDYVFFIHGCIELHKTTFDPEFLKTAVRLNDDLMKHFWDENEGGFFFTPDYSDELPLRRKEIYDGAVPSGNSIAYFNLIQLGLLTGEERYAESSGRMESALLPQISRMPSAYTQFLSALELKLGGVRLIS